MKYFSLLCISLYACISLKNEKFEYIKINKSQDVDLFYKVETDSLHLKKINYYVKNKTNTTFIIDPFGYRGITNIYKDEKRMKPYMLRLEGSYERSNDKSCKRDLVILLPKEIKKLEIFNTNYNDNAMYHFFKGNNYHESVKSVHNRQTATYFGCDEYIRNLEKKGYRVLEDSINTKIPIFPIRFSEDKNN